jgi:phosphoglycolate phosphatase-like HAD superfamily hydrolase
MITCLFDIDGTLLSSGGAGKAAVEAALCEEFAVELRVQVPYSGRTDRAIIRELFHQVGIAETPENLQKLLAGYLRRLPESLRRHNGRILPGIAALLQHLKQLPGVALGLLTGNVRQGAKVKLGHFGLYEHFRFGGFGDEHFDRDDVAREALRAVHQCVGPHCRPERMWIIGDTPLDVQCARAIGARVVAVATGYHSYEQLCACAPDLALHDLSDPQPLLRLLD